MRITPLAVWGHKLSKEELYEVIKLETSMTHSNQIAIDASYLYCFAIVQLINGKTAKDTYQMTKNEAKQRAPSTLYKYFEDVDNGNLPIVDKHIGHLKIAFMWAFHYLKSETRYEAALKDILMKGGDTDTNAAIVGGLLGALHTIDGIKLDWIEKVLSFTPDKAERHKQPDFLIPAYYFTPLL